MCTSQRVTRVQRLPCFFFRIKSRSAVCSFPYSSYVMSMVKEVHQNSFNGKITPRGFVVVFMDPNTIGLLFINFWVEKSEHFEVSTLQFGGRKSSVPFLYSEFFSSLLISYQHHLRKLRHTFCPLAYSPGFWRHYMLAVCRQQHMLGFCHQTKMFRS